MTLYSHNQAAYEKITQAFSVTNRAAIVHATGTGKSYIIARVTEDYSRCLIIAPNIFVLNETRKICREDVEFATYASMMHQQSFNKYDFICLDEFHRAGAEKWGGGIERLLAANPQAKILGTSATHIRYLDSMRNMADELFDGNVVSHISLKDAIDMGILPNPTYVSSVYDTDTLVNDVRARLQAASNDSIWKGGMLRHLDGISHSWQEATGVPSIIKKYFSKDMQRIIVFCSRVEKVDEYRLMLGRWLASAGFKRLRFYSIDYQENFLEKEMEDFSRPCKEGELKIAMSVNMLNEGVHVPNVNGIIMLRSTISRIIIEQQVGRCLTADNKGITPVVLDLVNNMDTVNYDTDVFFGEDNGGSSGEVHDTHTSFPFHVIDECRDIRMFLKSIELEINYKAEDVEPHVQALLAWGREHDNVITCECPEYAWFRDLNRSHRTPYFRALYERLRDMGLRLVSDITERESWFEKFDRVMEIKSRTGELPKTSEPYGIWVSNQRSYYRNGQLDDERAALVLKEFFVPEKTEEDLMNGTREYYLLHGELPPNGHPLAAFVNRFSSNDFKHEHLEWCYELINMGLKARVPYYFDLGIDKARENYAKCGYYITPEDRSLKCWGVAMRKKARNGELTDEQMQALNEIEFFVEKKINNGKVVTVRSIDSVVDEAEAYYREHGSLRGMGTAFRNFFQNNKKKILEREDLVARLVAIRHPVFFDEEQEMFNSLKTIVDAGGKPAVGSREYTFAQRVSSNPNRRFHDEVAAMNLFKDFKGTTKKNQELVSRWLAENKRFPVLTKEVKKTKNDEYYVYVCLHTWIVQGKSEELRKWAVDELTKYGLSHETTGKTKDEQNDDFKARILEFRKVNGRNPVKSDGNIGSLLDRRRRSALKNNDTEMITFLESIGVIMNPEDRLGDMFEEKLTMVVDTLRREKTITVDHTIYSLLKSWRSTYSKGKFDDYKVKRLKECGLILEDGTFCTYTNGREYKL